MKGHWYLIIGFVSSFIAALLWWKYGGISQKLVNSWTLVSIAILVFGAFNILVGVEYYIRQAAISFFPKRRQETITLFDRLFIILLIFLGSVSYTIASYYHLKMENWSFVTAFAIALPFILIEYQFSIRGNFAAKDILKMNAVQITLLTITFYFVNAWILNHFFLKQSIVWWREVLAFICIILAFILTTTTTHTKKT